MRWFITTNLYHKGIVNVYGMCRYFLSRPSSITKGVTKNNFKRRLLNLQKFVSIIGKSLESVIFVASDSICSTLGSPISTSNILLGISRYSWHYGTFSFLWAIFRKAWIYKYTYMLPYTLNIRLSIRLRCIYDVVVVLLYKKVLFMGLISVK